MRKATRSPTCTRRLRLMKASTSVRAGAPLGAAPPTVTVFVLAACVGAAASSATKAAAIVKHALVMPVLIPTLSHAQSRCGRNRDTPVAHRQDAVHPLEQAQRRQ